MNLKQHLLAKLKAEHAFWSYDVDSVSDVDDDVLIEKTLLYLDLPEIKSLYEIYSPRKIKSVWLHRLVPQGDYLRTLNKFFAWYLFGIKRPDPYLRSMETRYFNSLCQSKD